MRAWQILLDGKPNGSIADDDAARQLRTMSSIR